MPAWKIRIDPILPHVEVDGQVIPDVVGVDIQHRSGQLPAVALIVTPGPGTEIESDGIVYMVAERDADRSAIVREFLDGIDAEDLQGKSLITSVGQNPTQRLLEILAEKAGEFE